MGEELQDVESGILPLFHNVRERRLEPELMDRPDLDPHQHAQALAGLSRINAISRTAWNVWRPIRDYARATGKPIRVLDIASGGGDVAIDLSLYARRSGLRIEVQGCDLSDEAVAIASARAADRSADARFFQCDALNDALPRDFDVVTSTLFTHHLAEHDTGRFLRAVRAANPKLVVISDLIRGQLAFAVAHVACHVLTRSYIVHYDGPRSVAAAFTMREFSSLAESAGMTGHRIQWSWPFRFLFTWCPA